MLRVAGSLAQRGAAALQPGSHRLTTTARPRNRTSQRCIFTGCAVLKDGDESKNPTASSLQPEVEEEKEKSASGKDNLLNLISGMKVEMSSKKRFQTLRMQKEKEQMKNRAGSMESATSMFQKATEEIRSQSEETLNPNIVAAASAVASSMPFNKDQIESDLLTQLRKHESVTEAQKSGDTSNIGDIISSMKVGRRHTSRTGSRSANQICFDEDGQGYVDDKSIVSEFDTVRKRSLFRGKRINIFPISPGKPETLPQIASPPSLWDIELANQLAAVTEQLPRNGFEEMIQWTKEGKLWQFPINNEAGLDEEERVEFHEHIFLEKHLNGFPDRGPIRHFMELVINGLSRNPYITVQQKIEHIEWFSQYFQDKEDILKESEAYIN